MKTSVVMHIQHSQEWINSSPTHLASLIRQIISSGYHILHLITSVLSHCRLCCKRTEDRCQRCLEWCSVVTKTQRTREEMTDSESDSDSMSWDDSE